MTWIVEWDKRAAKEFKKMDKSVQGHILKYLNDTVVKSDNPRSHGDELKDSFSDLWRYSVGRYRIVCQLEDERCVIFVVRAAHRRKVYV